MSAPTQELVARLLMIEDDLDIATLAGDMLRSHGYAVHRAADASHADRILAGRDRIDLVILDLMLPGENGLALCQRLREAHHTFPILMLTALGSEADRVIGLETGADDYLVKPFAPRELLARVRALLRRAHPAAPRPPRETDGFRFDGFELDLIRLTLRDPAGLQVPVTSGEFALLVEFCRHPQEVLSRDRLLLYLHGKSALPYDRSIDTLVARLRRKIEPDPREPRLLRTIRSSGYYFSPIVEPIARREAA